MALLRLDNNNKAVSKEYKYFLFETALFVYIEAQSKPALLTIAISLISSSDSLEMRNNLSCEFKSTLHSFISFISFKYDAMVRSQEPQFIFVLNVYSTLYLIK